MNTAEVLMHVKERQGVGVVFSHLSEAMGHLGLPVRNAMRCDFHAMGSHDMPKQAVHVLGQCGCRSLPVEHNGGTGWDGHA
jgi:hypothetical protein